MLSDRHNRRLAALGKDLRRERPRPGDGFVDGLVRRIGTTGPPSRRPYRMRLGVGLAMTALLLVILGAFGGIGYAQSGIVSSASSAVDALKHAVGGEGPSATSNSASSHAGQFVAAIAVYPAPTVTCTLTQIGSSGKMRAQGTTTLASGTIDVVISDITGPSPAGFPYTPAAIAVVSTNWGPTASNGPVGTNGHTYRADVTQTASGFADGTTSCTLVLS
jgi:hypothetical protein